MRLELGFSPWHGANLKPWIVCSVLKKENFSAYIDPKSVVYLPDFIDKLVGHLQATR